MFSKLKFSTLVSFVLIATVTACVPKVGEAPPPEKVQSAGTLQCLTNLKPVLQAFGKGEASSEQVSSMWQCSEEAIKNFKRYVYGRTEDRFAPDELAKFLQDDFLDPEGPRITPELQTEFMQLKRLFLGGSADYLTRDELDKLVAVLDKFKTMSLRVNPYMKVLIRAWKPNGISVQTTAQIEYFEKASEAVHDVAEDLAGLILVNHQSYDINRLSPLVKEFAKFMQQDGDLARVIDNYLPVVKKVKKAVAGGDESQMAPQDWKNLSLTSAQGYLQYLRYYYFVTLAPQADGAVRSDYIMRSFEEFIKGLRELIAGKPESCITDQEISEALHAYAFANSHFKISDKLILESMKLKVLYFGGSTTSFTTSDMDTGVKKLAGLRTSLEKALPYYSVYMMQWNPDSMTIPEAQKYLQSAEDALRAAAAEAGTYFETSYDLQSLKEFLAEVDHLYGAASGGKTDPNSWLNQVSKYLPLVRNAKNLIFADQDSVIRKAQWSSFLGVASDGFGTLLNYHYFVSHETYGTSGFARGLQSFSDQVVAVLGGILKLNPAHALSVDQVVGLTQQVLDLGIIPFKVSESSLTDVVDVVLAKVFWPAELRLSGSTSRTLSSTSLANIQREFHIWSETERVLTQWGSRGFSHGELQQEVNRSLHERGLSPYLRQGLSEISLVISGPVPKVLDSHRRLIISRNSEHSYDAKSLSQLNLHRAIGRVVTRAGIGDRNRLDKNLGITLEEAQGVFARLRPALVDLGLVDPDNHSFIESRFREANVFTPHSDGNLLANFQEIADLVGMIFSGAEINAEFKKNLLSQCSIKARSGQDISLTEACVYDVYYNHFAEHMTSMPQFLKTFQHASPSEFQGYLSFILRAAGHIPNDKGTIQMSSLALAPHVIQYMEMLFARFDADQNAVIDTTEALTAYPSFAGVLTELTKKQPLIHAQDLPALFTYILYYGEPPAGLKDFIFKWLPWKSRQVQWDVQATRPLLAQIFSFIAEKTRSSDKPLIPASEVEAIQKHPVYRQQGPDPLYGGG